MFSLSQIQLMNYREEQRRKGDKFRKTDRVKLERIREELRGFEGRWPYAQSQELDSILQHMNHLLDGDEPEDVEL